MIRPGIGDLNINPSDPKSTTTSNDNVKANILANYFSSVFTPDDYNNVPKLPNKQIKDHMEILETTQEMVQHILKKINTSKSPGPDQLHPRLLSELYKHLKM